MSKQAYTFKSYLQKCKQLGTSCFWRVYGLLIIWFSLSQSINFGYATMEAQVIESTPLIKILTFAITLFLNFVLFVFMTASMTKMKLDVIHNQPLKLRRSMQWAASPKILIREALLTIRWILPYLIGIFFILAPSILPELMQAIGGNPIMDFIISTSYLLGIITIFVSPFRQICWMFAKFAMIDANCTPSQAIKKSKEITGYFSYWRVIGLSVLISLLVVSILSIPVIGMIIVFLLMPYLSVTAVAAYQRYLEAQKIEAQASTT